LTRHRDRLINCLGRGDPDCEALVAYAAGDLAAGKEIAEKIVASFASCPIGETTRQHVHVEASATDWS
jgi:hypothetical protein